MASAQKRNNLIQQLKFGDVKSSRLDKIKNIVVQYFTEFYKSKKVFLFKDFNGQFMVLSLSTAEFLVKRFSK